MSYSLINKCETCTKKDKCCDRHFIQGGINGIHDIWPLEKGHFGGGSVTIECQYHEEAEKATEE